MRGLVYLVIFLSGVVLFLFADRARKQKRFPVSTKKKENIFDIMAWYLYQQIRVRLLSAGRQNSFLEYLIQAPFVKRDLQALKPEVKIELAQMEYYVQKLKWFLMLLYAGDVLALCIFVSNTGAGILVQDRYVDKKNYGEGEQYANVRLETEDGSYGKEIQLVIDERVYTPEELDAFYEEAIPQLETMILSENKGPEEIKSPLYLPSSMAGYPFTLDWESSDYFLMDHKGVPQEEALGKTGESVTLTCHFSYRDWEREYQIPLLLFLPDKTEEELFDEQLQEVLQETRESQLYEAVYTLPKEVAGRKISWKEQVQDYSMGFLLLLFLAGCSIYFLQDKELHQKLEERNRQMLAEYPVLVNRLTLYLGAGMTMKSAWNKIAMDYRSRREAEQCRQYTYEEMLFTCYEMQSGVSESSAYERFGQRCGLHPYTRLAGLLNQSLKKGNAVLLRDLQKEASDAQEQRRSLARKKGEEAGTKLLMPMMMMLGIVMVLIMIPAFLSFTQ